MKDNTPNYLNPHNMDPSRVEAAPMLNAECGMHNDGEDAEAAHLEKLPGNDSVRPGQRIGTVGFVGHGRDKSLLNVCTAFLSQPEQGKPCADKLPTMSNDKAIKILERIETDIYGKIAISKAIDALRGGRNETD